MKKEILEELKIFLNNRFDSSHSFDNLNNITERNIMCSNIDNQKAIEEYLKNRNQRFSIDLPNLMVSFEKKYHILPSEVYQRAMISREVYWNLSNGKIKNAPNRRTLLALTIGYRLNHEDMIKLFEVCGYTQINQKDEGVVEFFVINNLYGAFGNSLLDDIMAVNEFLNALNLNPLGSSSR